MVHLYLYYGWPVGSNNMELYVGLWIVRLTKYGSIFLCFWLVVTTAMATTKTCSTDDTSATGVHVRYKIYCIIS